MRLGMHKLKDDAVRGLQIQGRSGIQDDREAQLHGVPLRQLARFE